MSEKDYQFILLLNHSFIFAIYACGKEKAILSVEDTIPANDTMITKDTTTTLTSVTGKFLALGDSYTIGQNVQEDERFPAQTVQLLKSENINLKIHYIATTGWTTTNLISAINSENPAKDFDIVTLLIGVNDQYQSRDSGEYRARFSELLYKAVELAGNRKSHVFVLSIPDYSTTPFVGQDDKARVSMQVDDFNVINKEITSKNNITYIDITPSTRKAANDPSLVANDGLHPSGQEYGVWASMLAALIKKVLQ